MLIAAAISCSSLAAARAHARPERQSLSPSAVADAVAVGTSGGADERHESFHAPYLLRRGGPVLQSIEIVTEFRRVVLLAEERVRGGAASWDARSAHEALRPYRGRLDLVLQLAFSPQNTYRSLPAVGVVIYRRGGGPELRPLHLEAVPADLAGRVPLAGTPILGATVEAAFPSSALDFGESHLVGVFLDGREVERVPVDLSRLR
jgi:hypothetical protein